MVSAARERSGEEIGEHILPTPSLLTILGLMLQFHGRYEWRMQEKKVNHGWDRRERGEGGEGEEETWCRDEQNGGEWLALGWPFRVVRPRAELTTAPASSCTYRHVITLIYQPRRKARALD